MSSKIAFMPISQSEKSLFNFKALSDSTNAWIVKLAKGLADLSVHDEQTIKSYVINSLESSFSSGKKTKKAKSADDIKHPKTAYIFFCSEHRKAVKEQNPNMSSKEITSELAKMWGDIDEDTKAKYTAMYQADKARYDAEKAEKSSASEASDSEVEEKSSSDEAKKEEKPKKQAKKAAKSETEDEGKKEKKVAAKPKEAVLPPPAELISKSFDEADATKFLKQKTIAEIVTFLRAKSQKPEFHLPKYNKNTKPTVITDALGVMLELDVSSF